MRRRELAIKWTLRESVEPVAGSLYTATPVRGPADVVAYLAPWASEAQECVIVLMLDCRMRILGHREVGRGTDTSCALDPRQVLRAALMGGAHAIILSHNHPSGDVTPSTEDIAATEKLKDAARVLDMPILDHVIVGTAADGAIVHSSMRERGVL